MFETFYVADHNCEKGNNWQLAITTMQPSNYDDARGIDGHC